MWPYPLKGMRDQYFMEIKGMKKLALLLTFLFMASSLTAGDFFDCCPDQCSSWNLCEGWEAEIRGAGVYSSSSRYRKIYSDWSPEVQVEVAKSVWGENLYGWFNVAYLWDNGHSTPFHNKTNIRMIPLTFGLKYLIPITCDFSAYIGGGAAYSFLRIHDHSDYVKQHISRQNWGGVIKSGIRYNICECFFLDGFVDYLFQHFSREHNHGSSSRFVETKGADLSGLRVGAGIGVHF